MHRDRNPLPRLLILVDLVTASLAAEDEASELKGSDQLPRRDRGQ